MKIMQPWPRFSARSRRLVLPTSTKCCGEGNLAYGRPAMASSEESNKKNYIRNGNDGDAGTRWCASNSQPSWWQVELEKPSNVKDIRIHWEKSGVAYKYTLEASGDGEEWSMILDQSKNKKAKRIVQHKVDATDAKYLRVNFLGTNKGRVLG